MKQLEFPTHQNYFERIKLTYNTPWLIWTIISNVVPRNNEHPLCWRWAINRSRLTNQIISSFKQFLISWPISRDSSVENIPTLSNVIISPEWSNHNHVTYWEWVWGIVRITVVKGYVAVYVYLKQKECKQEESLKKDNHRFTWCLIKHVTKKTVSFNLDILKLFDRLSKIMDTRRAAIDVYIYVVAVSVLASYLLLCLAGLASRHSCHEITIQAYTSPFSNLCRVGGGGRRGQLLWFSTCCAEQAHCFALVYMFMLLNPFSNSESWILFPSKRNKQLSGKF